MNWSNLMEQTSEERNRGGVPKLVKISQVKQLPLAPIVSTPADKRPVSTRRGISIFSPTQAHQQPTAEADPAQTAGPSTPGPSNLRNPPPPPQPAVVSSAGESKYRECLKNHAARNGAHVFDGCGEFIPSGDVDTVESLTCAACNCHRNFHRREVNPRQSDYQSHRPTPVSPPPSDPPNNCHNFGPAPPRMVNFGGGAASESSSEDRNVFQSSDGGDASGSKKRFRTKFSKEQKDRMDKLAGKFGWRIQKQDEEEVQRLCSEIGITREVFRVWMNNCKQTAKRRRNL